MEEHSREPSANLQLGNVLNDFIEKAKASKRKQKKVKHICLFI